MSILRILGFSALLTMPLRAETSQPVAIIYSLAGTTALRAPDMARGPRQLFDRLPAGTVLEVGPGSRVALAFANGLRYELGEGARVTLGTKNLVSRRGRCVLSPAFLHFHPFLRSRRRIALDSLRGQCAFTDGSSRNQVETENARRALILLCQIDSGVVVLVVA